MRLNRFIALATGLSRRAADAAITAGKVSVNGQPPALGQTVKNSDEVLLDGQQLSVNQQFVTLMLNKPAGYVCSRDGQGSRTIYDLLPGKYHRLKPVGRLDKDSTGLLLLMDDGGLANQLTHPRFEKTKVYQVSLDKELTAQDLQRISGKGIKLQDGLSRFDLNGSGRDWQVSMQEGRNRQIRRTFAALGYHVQQLHRIQFGSYQLGGLEQGKYLII